MSGLDLGATGDSGGSVGLDTKLWAAARPDQEREHGREQQFVLGQTFLTYIPDQFKEKIPSPPHGCATNSQSVDETTRFRCCRSSPKPAGSTSRLRWQRRLNV